jgi:hypothetical protein
MTASVGVSSCSVLEADSSAVSSMSQLPAALTRGAAMPQMNVQTRSNDKQLRKTTHPLPQVVLTSHLRIDHTPAGKAPSKSARE